MPSVNSSVAAVWRRSWERIFGSPARYKCGLKDFLLRFDGFMGVPVWVAKTSLAVLEGDS
jgi:hypothetical protein